MSDFAVKIILSASSPIPYYDVAPWVLGTLEASSGEATTSDSYGLLVDCSPVGEYADIAQGGNYVAVGDWTVSIHAVTPRRVKWWDAFRAAGASMHGARVELWDVTNSVCRAVGVVTDAALNGVEVQIECESILTARHKDIPARRLTKAEFPGISKDSEGMAVPMIYGSVERLAPPSMKSTQYIPAGYLVSEFGSVDKTLWSVACISASGGDFSAPYVTIYGPSIDELVGAASPESSDYGVQFWPAIPIGGGTLFVEVSSGTGSGQIRRIETYSTRFIQRGTTATWCAKCAVAAPWDTIPDATSTLKFYVLQIAEILIIGDEATVARTYAIEADKEFEIAAAQGIISGVVTSDISGEFRNGENYSAVSYVAPSENYGSIKLTDKRSDSSIVSNRNTIQILPANNASLPLYPCDSFCRTKISCDEFPDGVEEQTKIDCLFSFQSSPLSANTVRMMFIGEELDGTEVAIRDGQTAITGSMSTSFANYSPAICSDATYGNYSAYTVSIELPKPISAYASFRSCLLLPQGFGQYDQYVYTPSLDTGEYIAGATTIRVIDSAGYKIAAGDRIRPFSAFSAAEFSRGILASLIQPSDLAYAGPYSEWRTVQSVKPVTGGYWDVVIDTAFSVPTATYGVTVVRPTAPFQTISEVEAGFAFVYGEIAPDAEFRVDASSGRTYSASWPALPSGKTSGDPIMLARDASLDVLYRDLSIDSGNVDFASFQALPPNGIAAAMVEPERSDSVIARMAQEYNWIVSHDGAGRARAKTWLDRMWSTVADWTIANSDIIAQSMQEKTTAIDDVICQPSLYWSWTQADGFRSSAIVSDVTVDPDSLTSGNYLGTISGFGDFAESKAVLQSLQDAYSVALHRGENALYWKYGGDALILYVGSSRMWWAASRKRLLEFKISENHAAMASVVGDRVKVTHRRATAGIAVYGTLAGRWWHPVDGTVQLLVMLDPPYVDLEDGLFVDTIDPSGTVEQYIDQTDGTSEQYTDSIGATA